MKKVFFLLFASAVFSIGGCKSSHKDKDDTMDSTEMKNMIDQSMDSVNSMKMDTTHPMVDTMPK